MIIRSSRCLAALLLAFSMNSCKTSQGSGTSAIIGQDDRVPLLNTEMARGVGFIVFSDGYVTDARCNGFFITDNLVMTAAHCIDVDKLRHYSIEMINGWSTTFVAVKELNPSADLITLEAKNKSKAYFTQGSIDHQSELTVISFDPNRNEFLQDSKLAELAIYHDDGYFVHQLDTVKSASGSPLLQNGRVVGVQIGAFYDRPIRGAGSREKAERLENLIVIMKNNQDPEAVQELTDLIGQLSSSDAKLLGNLGVILGKKKPNLEKILDRLDKESLLPGANEEIATTISERDYADPQPKVDAPVLFSNTAKSMLERATSEAITTGFRTFSSYACAIKSTSTEAKKLAGELPEATSTLFSFINRPSIAARKNVIAVTVRPLNVECPESGGFVAGRARVDDYRTFPAGDNMTLHVFVIGINANCANRYSSEQGLWTNTIAHEMLHNLGQRHNGTTNDASSYVGRFVREYGNCVQYGNTWERTSSFGLRQSISQQWTD